MEIRLFALNNGNIVFNRRARSDTPLEKVCGIAEEMIASGSATYVQVSVDNNIYMELEA